MKGQAAIEYMLIFGFALLLSAPFITEAQSSIVDLRATSEVMNVQNAADSLENAARTVNAAGYPAKMTFFVKVPSNIDRTYVNQQSISYQVSYRDSVSNITRTFDFNVSGTIPDTEGRQRVSVEAKKDEVQFKVIS